MMHPPRRLFAVSPAVLFLLVTAPAGLTAQTAADGAAGSLGEAIRKGKAKVHLRYRFEEVGQDGFLKDAHASTLRTSLAYATQPYKGLSFEVEAENVAALGSETFANRGAGGEDNGVTDRPVVADVTRTEINQAFLRFKRGDSELTLGRREILLADVRLVGNVGWRQNHQSFDAFTLSEGGLDGIAFEYGFLTRVHRIFGDSLPMSSHFLNVAVETGAAGQLRLYGLLLDYDRVRDAGRSSLTWGAELSGERDAGSTKLSYEIELATQRDAGDNPSRIDAGYLHALAGVTSGGFTVSVGFEVLGGDARNGQFNTPLATLHAWNGWADVFLATPENGLEDLYLSVTGKLGERASWFARFHDFSARTGGASYGTELDLELRYTTPWNQLLAVTAALYDADGFAADTDKLMLWTTYGF